MGDNVGTKVTVAAGIFPVNHHCLFYFLMLHQLIFDLFQFHPEPSYFDLVVFPAQELDIPVH